MTLITSLILNGTDGSHAGGIKVTFTKLGDSTIFETTSDDEGRIKVKINSEEIDSFANYELIFETGYFWIQRGYKQIMDQVVFRFKIQDPNSDYHIPIIINPNSYSVWWSK